MWVTPLSESFNFEYRTGNTHKLQKIPAVHQNAYLPDKITDAYPIDFTKINLLSPCAAGMFNEVAEQNHRQQW
jgi:hypothetical protein